MQHKWSK